MLKRLKLWLKLWKFTRYPDFAIIYDSAEGIDLEVEDRREEYYEVFDSEEEAWAIFESAFPKGNLQSDGCELAHNPRLVLILDPNVLR